MKVEKFLLSPRGTESNQPPPFPLPGVTEPWEYLEGFASAKCVPG